MVQAVSDFAEGSPDALLAADPTGRLLWANRAAERLFGWRAADWVGANCLELIHPDDLELAALSLVTVLDKEVGSPLELRVATAGGWRLVEVVGTSLPADDGTSALLLSLRDLTERRRWEVSTDRTAMERSLIHNAASLTLLVAADGTITSASGSITRHLGHDPESLEGAAFTTIVAPEDRSAAMAAVVRAQRAASWASGTPVTVEARLLRRSSGEPVPYELTLVGLVDDPTVAGVVVSGHDISRLRAAQEELRHLAHHDPLTGLPNRLAATRALEERLGRPRHGPITVCYLDLDRFKPVNDLFGHDAGDALLIELSRRLVAACHPGDVVARTGGDEFAVIASGLDDSAAAQLAARLEAAASHPFDLPQGRVQVYASVGHIVAQAGMTAEALMNEADGAMTVTKRARRGGRPVAALPVDRRRAIAEELASAFEHGQLIVHYQPIVALDTGLLFGAEALIRWEHPTLGMLSPADFLTVAEDIGRDRDISELVLRSACRVIADAACEGRDLTVSVNVSLGHLTSPTFPESLADILAASGFPPDRLWLEITERAVLERSATGPSESIETALAQASALGVRLAIDDFGTGFSSLTHLMDFPIDVLKIDQSFIANVIDDPRSRAMVSALLSLAEGLGIVAVAEGIETEEQLKLLRSLRCPMGQGYLLGRPTTAQGLADVRPLAARV